MPTKCTAYNHSQRKYCFHTNIKELFDYLTSRNILGFIEISACVKNYNLKGTM